MRKRFESREYQRVPNMRFHKSNRIYSVIFLMIIVCVIQYEGYKYHKWKETDSKAPDVASSISVNNYHYLTVIANRKKIDDKEVFAREIIHMCLQNSFHSVKFSTRINGYPSGPDIAVYLRYNDMEKKDVQTCFKGTVKTILGFIVLNAGSSVVQDAIIPFGDLFQIAFGVEGVVPNNEAITSMGLTDFAVQTASIFALGMCFNLVLARFSKLNTSF